MNIPQELINQLEEGNAVLFLGAGASRDALHPTNEVIPDAKKLTEKISHRFLDDSYATEPLISIAELAISESDLFSVQSFIYDLISPYKASTFHKIIPTFRWKSIYTTNYDTVIEDAYYTVKERIQELYPVIRNTRIQQIFKKPNTLPYYKLHGCLSTINDLTLPLILTPEQYITHQLNRERLFSKLAEEAFNYTIVFVGYSFTDVDIRAILHILEKEKEGRPRFYMVGPFIKDAEERLWEGKKITSIKSTFKEFLEAIDKKISLNVRKLSKARPEEESPIYSKFIISTSDLIPSSSLINFINNDIDYIHSSLASPQTLAKEFYKGYFENWDPIIRNLDVDRSIKDGILSEAFIDNYYASDDEGQFLFLIKGFAGSGKSVLLKRLAWDAGVSFDKFCIFLHPNTSLRYENISELYNYLKLRIYLFIDNPFDKEEEIIKVLSKAKKDKIPLTIIIAERVNVWNNENNQLQNFLTVSYNLEYLNDKEIEALLKLLEKHQSLGYLEKKTHDERVKLLSYQSGRELLVALYEATNGRPFRDIVKDEYEKIESNAARSLYLTVCILHRLGSVSRAGLISRVHGINFDRFKREFFKPLEFIVFDRKDYKINDFVYQTRHPHIADIVFETVLISQQERFDEYVRIISYLDVDFDSDRNAFVSMTNARKLLEIFSDQNLIRNFYEIAEKKNPDNSKLLQQQAIFEAETNHMFRAEEIIRKAHKLNEEDPIILHTFSELEFKKGENARSNIEKEKYFKKAISLSEDILKNFTPTPHTYHTILKALIARLELALLEEDNPSIERLIKDIERKFRDAKQYFPYQEFLLEAESRFNALIKNAPQALELLEKAFNINKSSPFIASRLSHFYEENNDIRKAISVIKETIKFIPGDKDINYEYARLLTLENDQNYSDILYYLRRSFTEGDNRFQAQFWYGRTLYLSNDIPAAKEVFKRLSNIPIDPEIRSRPTGIVLENGKPKVFYGKISAIETSFGFLKRDVFGDDFYFFRYEQNYNWEIFKSSMKVSFNFAFNYRGAMAINLKIIS